LRRNEVKLPTTKRKILFIGLGSIGQRHLRNVYSKYGEDITLLAYRAKGSARTISQDLTTEENIDIATKYPLKIYTDLKEALSQSPDMAFICNPTSLHLSLSLAVAKAGYDLFIEKPISHSMEGVDELVSVCKSKEIVCAVGCQFRFHPSYTLLKKLISEKAVGNILSVHAEVGEYLPHYHKYEDYRKMYASRSDLGGGVIFTQIHEIDYLYDLFGMPDWVSASGGHLSGLDIDVEDTADILMEMSFSDRKLPVSLHMDYIQRPPVRTCKIIGEAGRILADFQSAKVILEKSNMDTEVYDNDGFERNNLFIDEIEDFFYCIEQRTQPVASLGDGQNGLRIALAVKESMEKRKSVFLK